MEKMNRREFIGASMGGTVAMSAALGAAAQDKAGAPKLRIGLIGCGGYGMANVRAAFKAGGAEVIAICDIDSQHLESSAERIEKIQGSRPRRFKQ
ncbi:MAG: hypothetical protein AMJ65_13435, partial [Phycisphaerae bacterium SG8_4]